MFEPTHSRRAFIKRAIGVGAAASAPMAFLRPEGVSAAQDARIRALDHVAIPIERTQEMISFYRALGFGVNEGAQLVSVHFGDQKINLHTPTMWQRGSFTLRAPAATPPCGDFCWVWEGSRDELIAALERAGAEIEAEGERQGGRDGGTVSGQSIYVRDPDGNLLEFIRYA